MTDAHRGPVASAHTGWRKSSYSGGGDDQGGDSCVEVLDGYATSGIDGVSVRDSKTPRGPAIVVSPGSWSAFVAGLKGGDGQVRRSRQRA